MLHQWRLACLSNLIAVLTSGILMPSAAPGADTSRKEQSTLDETKLLVYYVGTVERTTLGRAIIDLGDVHDIRVDDKARSRDKLAIFKATDNYFEPVGVVTAERSHGLWTVTSPTTGLQVEPGQIVIQIRSVAELSTGERIRDGFLAYQKIVNSNRNGYSTMRSLETASTLRGIEAQQPRWLRTRQSDPIGGNQRIAGIIESPSQPPEMPQRLKNLLGQINQFRRLHDQGHPVVEAAGPEWASVMSILTSRPRPANVDVDTEVVETEVVKESESKPIAVVDIRLAVGNRMFQRNPQEKAIATAYAAAILHSGIDNEKEWLDRETTVCMFPELKSDEPFKDDIMYVCRRLREQQQ